MLLSLLFASAPASAQEATPAAVPVPTEAPAPAPAVAPATETGRSVCELEVESGLTLELILLHTVWKKWESFCPRLGRYLRSPAGTALSADDRARLLRESPSFERAECSQLTPDRISCGILPADVVYRVKIVGKIPFAILQDDLRRRIFLRPGTSVTDLAGDLARQRSRLKTFLEKEGYFGSEVTLSTRRVRGAEPGRGLELEARIEAGRPARLRKIELTGQLPAEVAMDEVQELFTHRTLGLWRDRFVPRRAEEDAEALAEVLQERGYPEARVKARWEVDAVHHGADLTLGIDAGPRVVVRFLGNRKLRTRDLEKHLSFREVGAADAVEAETSAEAMRKAYQERGYANARVDTVLATPEEGTLWHSFEVTEGERTSVATLAFEGNTVFSSATLEKKADLKITSPGFLRRSRLVDDVLAADRRAIEAYYKLHGYAATEVESRTERLPSGDLRVVHHIDEGPRRWVKWVTMEGLPPEIDPVELEAALGLRDGTPYIHSLLAGDRREIHAWLARAGYGRPEVKRDLERPKPEEGGPATIHYRITSGPKSHFGGVLVSGNFRTQIGLLEERLSLDPGDDLDLMVLGRSRRALLELGPFSTVDLVPLGTWRPDGQTWLSVAVKERTATTLDLVLAYSTDDGISLGADLRDRNLLGRAVRLDAKVRAGLIFAVEKKVTSAGDPPIESTRLDPVYRGTVDTADLLVSAPEPFGAPFDLSATGFYHYRNTPRLEKRIGIASALSRVLLRRARCDGCPDLTVAARYELSANTLEQLEGGSSVTSAEAANIGRIIPSFSADWRDSLLDPRQGAFVEARLEWARPFLSPLSEGASFVRALASGQFYLGLGTPFAYPLENEKVMGGPIILAVGGRLGLGWPGGGAGELPQSETFAYGGDASVRGLPLRVSQSEVAWPLARRLLEGTVELRWYLLQNVGFGTVQLAFFADAAAVSDGGTRIVGPATVTVGPALRYVTPVGPISLAWGLPVVLPEVLGVPANPETEALVSGSGRLHLTFGYTF